VFLKCARVGIKEINFSSYIFLYTVIAMQYTRNSIYDALFTECNSCVYLNVYSQICEKRRLDSSWPSFSSSWNNSIGRIFLKFYT